MCKKTVLVSLCVVASLILTVSIPVTQAAQAQSEKVTITYADWHWLEDVWSKSLEEAMAKFERMYPNIRIEPYRVSHQEKDIKIPTAIRGGRGPDTFAQEYSLMRQYVDSGWAEDLTPFIEKDSAADLSYLDDFYETNLVPVTVDGHVYGLPRDTAALVLVYNKELFKKAGLDPYKAPETYEGLLEYAQKLTKDTDGDGKIDQWGLGSPFFGKSGFELRSCGFFWGHGATFLTPDWKHSALDTPEAKEAFKYVVDLYRKHEVLPPGTIDNGAHEVRRLLAHQTVAMIVGSTWTIPIVDGLAASGWNVPEVLEMAPMPIKKGMSIEDLPKKAITSLYMCGTFMNPNTEHPEEAWKLIKFISAPEQMKKWFLDNNMPATRKSVNTQFKPLLENKFAKVVTGQIPNGGYGPMIPQWPEIIIGTIRPELQNAATGMKTPEKALADAHRRIESILSEE